MRSRSLRPHRVRPTTALALITVCLVGAAAQASSPAQVATPRRVAPEPIPVRVPAAVPEVAPVVVPAPTVVPVSFTQTGIPANLLAAYRSAEALAPTGCALRWYHLAGIGHVESGHARGGRADPAGDTSPRILGPVLAGGPGVAAIPDTDGGTLDADPVWDRAVGPMQFIPSTWASYRTDGNGDGTTNPHNIHDATAAAGRYLCAGGMNLSNPSDLSAAVYRYNHSTEYVSTVLMWMHRYSAGATPLPPLPPGMSSPDSVVTAHLPADPPPDVPLPEPLEPPKPDPTPNPTPEPTPLPEPVQPPNCETLLDTVTAIVGDLITPCPTTQSPQPPPHAPPETHPE